MGQSPRRPFPIGSSRLSARTVGRIGPVDAASVRQWILQGFANAHTWVPAESRGNWKRLSDFPEFADALAGNEIPTNMLGTPPKEMLWEEPVKVGPSMEPEATVTFREETPLGEGAGPPSEDESEEEFPFMWAWCC